MMLTDYPYVSRCLCYLSSYPRLPFQDCQTYPAGAIGTLTPRAEETAAGETGGHVPNTSMLCLEEFCSVASAHIWGKIRGNQAY